MRSGRALRVASCAEYKALGGDVSIHFLCRAYGPGMGVLKTEAPQVVPFCCASKHTHEPLNAMHMHATFKIDIQISDQQ